MVMEFHKNKNRTSDYARWTKGRKGCEITNYAESYCNMNGVGPYTDKNTK